LADVARQLDARAHRRPPGPPILALVLGGGAFRRLAQLLFELLRAAPRPADRVDLLLDLPRALLDPLFGDLFVVEDDQLANRAVAGVEPIPEVDDIPGNQRRARD